MSDRELFTQLTIYVTGASFIIGLIITESLIFCRVLTKKWKDRYIFRRVFWANIFSYLGGLYQLFPVIWFTLFLKNESGFLASFTGRCKTNYYTTYFLTSFLMIVVLEFTFYLIFLRKNYPKTMIFLLTVITNLLTFIIGVTLLILTGMVDLNA